MRNNHILRRVAHGDNFVCPNQTFVFDLANEWIAAFWAAAIKLGRVHVCNEWNTKILFCENASFISKPIMRVNDFWFVIF